MEKEYRVKILKIEQVTHDVRRFILEKPKGYRFIPGQANDITLDKEGWRDEKRPFSFTSLNEDPYLEFTIKIYPAHQGVTEKLGMLKEGDFLILREPFGAIQYKSPGVFIAGGAGITPFIAIFRQLYKEGKLTGNTLLFSNKTKEDVILENELKKMLGKNCIFTLTREEIKGYDFGRIDVAYLQRKIKDFRQRFYVCGPPRMVKDIKAFLEQLGVEPDTVVFEE